MTPWLVSTLSLLIPISKCHKANSTSVLKGCWTCCEGLESNAKGRNYIVQVVGWFSIHPKLLYDLRRGGYFRQTWVIHLHLYLNYAISKRIVLKSRNYIFLQSTHNTEFSCHDSTRKSPDSNADFSPYVADLYLNGCNLGSISHPDS